MLTIITSIIFLSVVGILGLFFFFNYIIHKIFYLPHVHNEKTPVDFDIACEEYFVKTNHGKQLQVWDIQTGKPEITIVGIHGWANSVSVLLPLAKALSGHWRVVLINTRNHGKSDDDGHITLIKYKEDLIHLIDHIRSKETLESKLVLLGHSLGAAASLFAASRDNRIDGVISISTFADLEEVLRKGLSRNKFLKSVMGGILSYIEFRTGEHIHELSPKETIRKYKGPVLVAHGTKDEVIDFNASDRIVENAERNNVQKLVMKDHNHGSLLKDQKLADEILQFIDRFLDT